MAIAPMLDTFQRLLVLACFLHWSPCSFNLHFTLLEAPYNAVTIDSYIWFGKSDFTLHACESKPFFNGHSPRYGANCTQYAVFHVWEQKVLSCAKGNIVAESKVEVYYCLTSSEAPFRGVESNGFAMCEIWHWTAVTLHPTVDSCRLQIMHKNNSRV